MKKNNTAEKTIQNAEQISKALKEGTEKTLKSILQEAIANMVMESEEDEEPASEDSFEVEDDVTTNETPVDVEDTEDDAEEATDEVEGEDADAEGETEPEAEDAEDEWSDMEQFKVGDDDYDFTGVDGETALKVYNKLGDDDQIFIKKDEDGNYEVKDEETGAEYVIELNNDAEADETEAEVGTPEEDAEFEFDFGDEEEGETEPADGEETEPEFNIEITNDDESNEDELNEDQNMMVNDYQKDVMPGLNTKEPADKKATYSMDGGAPDGNSRPYGKRGDDDPFKEKVNECGDMPATEEPMEEAAISVTSQADQKMTKSKYPKREVAHVVSENGALQEAATKIFNKAKEIQKQNKLYEACIEKLKKSVYEAATLNVNMGKVIKLLVNETCTSKEKQSIIERFSGVKTITEGKMLYDTIKKELNESKSSKTPILENQQISAKPSTLNETTIYTASNPSLDLMSRMDNLYK